MVMKAIYAEPANCSSCIDLGWTDDASYCNECVKSRRKEVTIIQLGVGKDGDKAVIQTNAGRLGTVPIDRLTLIADAK